MHGHHQEPNAGVGTHSKWLSSTPAAGILGSAFLRLLANVCILETKNRIPVCGVQYSFFVLFIFCCLFVQVMYYYLLGNMLVRCNAEKKKSLVIEMLSCVTLVGT